MNVKISFLFTQVTRKHMIEQHCMGSIINISLIAGRLVGPERLLMA
jgi:NAD(P)-dependent dehydrogenase (short-subunit alcohol dehydrogenase family)